MAGAAFRPALTGLDVVERGADFDFRHELDLARSPSGHHADGGHVPVADEAVTSFVTYWQLGGANELTFDTAWTPFKRVRTVRDSMPLAARKSSAWHSP